jgi:hypothetical protein
MVSSVFVFASLVSTEGVTGEAHLFSDETPGSFDITFSLRFDASLICQQDIALLSLTTFF